MPTTLGDCRNLLAQAQCVTFEREPTKFPYCHFSVLVGRRRLTFLTLCGNQQHAALLNLGGKEFTFAIICLWFSFTDPKRDRGQVTV